MKADIFIQDRYCASIDLPSDSLIALLACGLITEAQRKADQLHLALADPGTILCTITLRLAKPVAFPPAPLDPADQDLADFIPNG